MFNSRTEGTQGGSDFERKKLSHSLFNALPKHLRNSKGKNIEDFKTLLDKHLESIPDEPKVGDYIPSACDQITLKPSNSLICQTQKIVRIRGS